MINTDLMKPIELAVYNVLLDGGIHTRDDLFELCKPQAVRDVIKALKTKYGLLIHGRGKWYLDTRHILGDSKSRILATAEAKVRHSDNSLRIAKRESFRVSSEIENNKRRRAEWAELIGSPNTKAI